MENKLKKYPALICARGGSKGVPGKNIRKLAGIPLIGHAILKAMEVENISEVFVSTDSDEIAEVARKYGAIVPFRRPEYLAEDDSPEWKVWQHAVRYLQDNYGKPFFGMVVIPATAPLRSAEDIRRCVETFEENDCDCVITVTEAHRSPYFNMVLTTEDGYSHLVIEREEHVFRRQDVPVVYDMTTVAYVVHPEFVLSAENIFSGKVKHVVIPVERALDIDTELDFKIAEFLLKSVGEK
ncbi:acylneuraminate cytidylyltransferase [Desulfomarina profundi]|uniref:Acylneuraminate cytidylyltransferase n=1 Tax=Desulfomarina profundi TaxID=2772557 RepID=A0A8D5JGV5_9BACT|nr:acylneuraminate cytidylyltransferase [Desulfomarina profundi]